MSIKDRGIIKWQPAAFMPEQRTLMKKMFDYDKKIARPILDEYQIELINNHLCDALENGSLVKFQIYKNGFISEFGPVIIEKLDTIEKTIKTRDKKGCFTFIKYIDVVNVEFCKEG